MNRPRRQAQAATPAAAVDDPTASPVPSSTAAVASMPAATPELTLGLPDLVTAKSVDLAPLGTFVVAREGAGIPTPAAKGQAARLEIAVYETRFGAPRTLLDINEIDGVNLPVSLINWSDNSGALVMRMIAGDPDDDWLIAQAPTRPHNQFVWSAETTSTSGTRGCASRPACRNLTDCGHRTCTRYTVGGEVSDFGNSQLRSCRWPTS